MFRPVSADLEFVAIEEAELARWKANNVFERSVDAARQAPSLGSSTRAPHRERPTRTSSRVGAGL